MKTQPWLFLLGVGAWTGVAFLSIAMAEIDEPVWGWFPIVAGVFGAWAVGEFITDVIWKAKGGGNA